VDDIINRRMVERAKLEATRRLQGFGPLCENTLFISTPQSDVESGAERLEEALLGVVTEGEEWGNGFLDDVSSARSFADGGVLTNDRGFTMVMSDGSEYQVTIVQTRQARTNSQEDSEGDDDDANTV
jgi:hypothetical protein